ncbi:MAG: NUDIX hydrolase [Patescibacteria group bacterium]|nr:NUDIX hydrolase [Patescibacteria group bacterium]
MDKQFFAQKGLVVNDRGEVLMLKYAEAHFQPSKLNGKWALPGGKIDAGETPKESLVREVQEETGVACDPLRPLYVWNWEYKKGDDNIQINTVMFLCKYISGTPITKQRKEKELSIEKVSWIPASEIKNLATVEDELPGIEIFLDQAQP